MSGRRARWIRKVVLPLAGKRGYRSLKREYVRDLTSPRPSSSRGPRVAGTFTSPRMGGAS